jgi:HSP90 family molecular chaperone
MLAKKTLELNPHHPVIKELLNKVKTISISPNDDVEEEVKEYADLLFNMALLNSGFLIENPTDFTEPM